MFIRIETFNFMGGVGGGGGTGRKGRGVYLKGALLQERHSRNQINVCCMIFRFSVNERERYEFCGAHLYDNIPVLSRQALLSTCCLS